MSWSIDYLPEVHKDMDRLSGSQRTLVKKAIERVGENPLPQSEGGYGKPLGHKRGSNLTNLLKIKLRDAGIRVVYKVEKRDTRMIVIVVGVREDEEAHEIAFDRRIKDNL